MRTIRRFAALAVLLGSWHLSMAQDATIPKFNSDSEKQAWIEAHPEQYRKALSVKQAEPVRKVEHKDLNVRSSERFASEAEKQAWIEAHPEEYRQSAVSVRGAKQDPNVRSTERFSNEEEKKAWIDKNPRAYQKELGKERFASDEEKEAFINAQKSESKKQ